LELRGLNNALYAISDDNTGLGVQPVRARNYLAAAEPWGPKNPAIYYTGACLWQELGEPNKVLDRRDCPVLALLVQHIYPGVDPIHLTSPTLARTGKLPGFSGNSKFCRRAHSQSLANP